MSTSAFLPDVPAAALPAAAPMGAGLYGAYGVRGYGAGGLAGGLAGGFSGLSQQKAARVARAKVSRSRALVVRWRQSQGGCDFAGSSSEVEGGASSR